jgi:hypothetical protein
MTMDRGDLERAAKANEALTRAERDLEALKDFKVFGILIDRGDGGLRPITLQKGTSGTGSVSSIGYPDDLRDAMTTALHDHFLSKVETARADLARLGISIAA